ncbi:MAG: methyltransferase family protein, partial [Isosphaeraceae bacterium]
GLFGWALVFRSAIGVLVALLMLPPLVARMNSEEALLESEFGARYSAYRRRTWRLLPFLY